MSEFDPFGGYSPQGNEKPKSNFKLDKKTMELIKKVIILLVVFGIIGGTIYYFFFNNITIYFSVIDTEGKNLNSTEIKISTGEQNKSVIYSPGEDIKLNKNKKYKYSINLKGYKSINGQLIPKDIENTNITIKLEKNIRLDVLSFICPPEIFTGQIVKCELQLNNISENEDYNLENLIFEYNQQNKWKDLNDETLRFVDGFNQDIPISKTIGRKTKDTVFVLFKVPENFSVGTTQKIMARVKYTDNKKSCDIKISQAPNIIFSSELSGSLTLESGNEITKIYTIDNTKNKADISGLELKIDANYEPSTSEPPSNININDIFITDYTSLSVNASSRSVGQISIKLPANLRAGKINGTLTLNSPIFSEPKKVSFIINVKEPENKFTISLTKNTETLTYDANKNITTIKQVTLNLDNKNKIPVHINSIYIENSTGTTDCNHWIVLPVEYNGYDIQPNNNPAPIILLQGSNLGSLTTVTGLKICNINVDYKHPYLDENIVIKNKIQISVN